MSKGKYEDRNGKSGVREQKAQSAGFGGFEFVKIELTGEEKDEYRSLLEAGEFEGFGIEYYADAGYKVSISKPDADGGYLVSLSARGDNHPNACLVLTGRGGSPERALAVCAYKDKYLCVDSLWREAINRRRGSSEDIA